MVSMRTSKFLISSKLTSYTYIISKEHRQVAALSAMICIIFSSPTLCTIESSNLSNSSSPLKIEKGSIDSSKTVSLGQFTTRLMMDLNFPSLSNNHSSKCTQSSFALYSFPNIHCLFFRTFFLIKVTLVLEHLQRGFLKKAF